MSNLGRPGRRFAPDATVAALVAEHGASKVGLAYGLDADVLRRYLDGASQRTTRFWIELHRDRVAAELSARPVRLLRPGLSPAAPMGLTFGEGPRSSR